MMIRRGTDAIANIEKIREMFTKFKFFPVIERSHRSIGDSLLILGGLDISLITDLVKHTGFPLATSNDFVIEQLLSKPVSAHTVKTYLDVGFKLSDIAIKRTIAWGRPIALNILAELVEPEKLNELALQTVHEMFGPYQSLEKSLNVPWNSQATHRIFETFKITEGTIRKAILNDPEHTCTSDKPYEVFPVTRPYYKARPYPIWTWILETYG
jgi:hypothetical protein